MGATGASPFGADDLTLKVSLDGSARHEALQVGRAPAKKLRRFGAGATSSPRM